jgi:2-polyprenyl-3-methyl-5-hydroxy-6-metoxy-1,4-benzoquinol methylase
MRPSRLIALTLFGLAVKKEGRFGDRIIAKILPPDLRKRFTEGASDGQLEVPDGDKGLAGERDDLLSRGKFLPRFEHISRYSGTARKAHGTVLDIGCGTGYGAAILSTKASVVALDISPAALRFARKSYSGPEFVMATAISIPLADESVDMVTAFEIIEHLVEPDKFLTECHRTLKKGGVLVLSSPNPAHLINWLKNKLLGIPIPPKMVAENIYHVREFTHDEMVALLSSKGFKLVHDAKGQTIDLPYIRGPFRFLGIGEVYDVLFSRLGNGFPRISYTVVYVASK